MGVASVIAYLYISFLLFVLLMLPLNLLLMMLRRVAPIGVDLGGGFRLNLPPAPSEKISHSGIPHSDMLLLGA